MQLDELRALVNAQAELMVDVSTGGPRIRDENSRYQARRREIGAELRRLGLDDPNPHRDLWAWHGHWSQQLPTYQSRRDYIREIHAPLLDALEHLGERHLGSGMQAPQTGWGAADHQLSQLRERYAISQTADD